MNTIERRWIQWRLSKKVRTYSMHCLVDVYTAHLHMEMLLILKMYRGKDCVEKFIEYIQEGKRLYATFPQKPMAELTDVLKRENESAWRFNISFKEFNAPENRALYVINVIQVYAIEQPTTIATWNIEYQTTFQLCFTV